MSQRNARRFSLRRITGVAAAIAIGIGVAGCSGTGAAPGTAAVVNGVTITERDVTVAVDEWAKITGQSVSRDQMVMGLVPAQTYIDAAAEAGVEVPDEEIDGLLAQTAGGMDGTLTVADLSPSTVSVLRSSLAIQALSQGGSEEGIMMLMEASDSMVVKVNPRYGFIEDGQLVPPSTIGDGFSLPGLDTGSVEVND